MTLGLLSDIADLLKTSPSQLIEQDLTYLIQNNKIKNSSINGDVYNHQHDQNDQLTMTSEDLLNRLIELVAELRAGLDGR